VRRLLDHTTLTIGVPAEAKYLDALACYKAAFVACSLVLIPMVVSSWYLDDFKYVFGKVIFRLLSRGKGYPTSPS